MSVVWRAEDQILGREVAVKVLSAEVAADPAALRRLYAEARAAARLRHGNVVEVYDYGETAVDGTPMPYVVMELVEGRSLSALLSAGPLPWRLGVLIGAQVAAALAAAHDHGVVHRDVKPANVMVAAGGAKLVDFGISAAVGDHETVADEIIGTPAYLAPERLINGTVRPSTDVYALGVLLYLMLAGRMPWNASTTTQMLMAHRYRDPAPLPHVPGLPGDVASLVHQCLAKTPSERPPAVTAARILRQAAGLPPVTLLTTMTGDAGRAATDTPTEALSPTAAAPAPSSLRERVLASLRDRVPASLRDRAPARLRDRVLAWPARYRAAAVAAALAGVVTVAVLCWPSGARPVSTPAAAAVPLTCHVSYTTGVVSPGHATTTVAVTNTASRPTGPWTLAFRLPGGQRLAGGTQASWRQSGETIRASGPAIAAGATTRASFVARYGEVALLPQAFTLNDVPCRAELFVRGTAATPAVSPATKTPDSSSVAVARVAANERPPGRAPAVLGPGVQGPGGQGKGVQGKGVQGAGAAGTVRGAHHGLPHDPPPSAARTARPVGPRARQSR
jgi:serine/threonine-protein kinase